MQEITLSMNIEGNWTLPDDSQSTNSVLTIPNFSSRNIGDYKFYIKNWDDIEVCAVQIHLGIIGMFKSKIIITYVNSTIHIDKQGIGGKYFKRKKGKI